MPKTCNTPKAFPGRGNLINQIQILTCFLGVRVNRGLRNKLLYNGAFIQELKNVNHHAGSILSSKRQIISIAPRVQATPSEKEKQEGDYKKI